jgi:tetratricopeptide (TPR) repeat protein
MGFLVDDTHIVTCAHVISSSTPELGSDDILTQPDDPVAITFVFIDREKEYTAHVEHWGAPLNAPCPDFQDIAILKLDDPKPKLARPACLINHEEQGGTFMAYGYPECFEGAEPIWAQGSILGRLDDTNCFQIQHERDVGIFVQQGFSGTAVWAKELKGVVGMIVSGDKKRGIATAIPMDAIERVWPSLKPFVTDNCLPPICNLPYLRNKSFTGREELIANLRAAFASEDPTAHKQAITGILAVGKTQLALEYAYRFHADHAVTWWIRSEDPRTLAAGYARLATELNLSIKDSSDQTAIVNAVRRWFETNQRWLIIFDNVLDQNAIYNYLPRTEKGSIIITSRDPKWGNKANVLDLAVFDRHESIELLTRLTGQHDDITANELAEELGDLPLAIAQVGAYCEVHDKSLADYLKLFRKRKVDLLEHGEVSDEYHNTVTTTCDIAWSVVHRDMPAAATLFNFCAFLAPDDIPLSLLLDGVAKLPAPANVLSDELEFGDAIVTLSRHALVTKKGDFLSVHRLVQLITRDRLSGREGRKLVELAIQLLNDAFCFDENHRASWLTCEALAPHILQVKQHADSLEIKSETFAALLTGTGSYLRFRADYNAARVFHQQALAIRKEIHGDKHPDVATSLDNLGHVYESLGEYPQAKHCYEQALTIRKGIHGDKHPDVATSLNGLGLTLWHLGEYPEAREHLEKALATYEAVYGPYVATALNNLGLVFDSLAELEKARACHEQALALRRRIFGNKHQAVGMSLNNLGAVLLKLGYSTQAREKLEEGLAIYKAVYGEEHPNVARVLNTLGCVFQDLHEYLQAKEKLEEAVRIGKVVYDDGHPEMIGLSKIYREFLDRYSTLYSVGLRTTRQDVRCCCCVIIPTGG